MWIVVPWSFASRDIKTFMLHILKQLFTQIEIYNSKVMISIRMGVALSRKTLPPSTGYERPLC